METNNEEYTLMNDAVSAFPVHPGEILGEELKARGIKHKDFARKVGMQTSHLSALIHGMRSFSPEVSQKIASGLEGIPAQFWVNLQEKYNVDVSRRKVNTSRLVSGYNVSGNYPRTALACSQERYGSTMEVSVQIPCDDFILLESLSSRLGWTVISEGK